MKPLTLALNQICPGRASKGLTVALATHLGVADTLLFHHSTENTLNSIHKVGLLKTP